MGADSGWQPDEGRRYRGASKLRLKTCAVIGSGLGVYVVLAVAFHWLVAPSVARSQAAIPPPAAVVQRVEPPSSHFFHPGLPPRVVPTAPPSGTLAASEPAKSPDAAPRKATRKSVARTTRQAQPARDSWNPFSFAFGQSTRRF